MFFKKIVFRNYFLAAGLLAIASVAIVLIARGYLPPLLPLFYGKPVGMEELAPRDFLFFVPIASICISFINILISKSAKDDFIKKILAVSSLIVSFMSAVTVIKIILLIGFF